MSPRLLFTVGLMYLWVAGTYAGDGRYGMAIAFAAYALANVGFAMDGWK